jgi:flagellar biosynthesis/type III secretory pathway protein FliH
LVRFVNPGIQAVNRTSIMKPAELGSAVAGVTNAGSKPQPNETDTLLEKIKNLLTDVSLKLDELAIQQSRSLHDLQEFAVHMAAVIASVVVCDEVKSSDARIRALIETAFNQTPDGAEIAIRLNPIDLERIKCSAFSDPRPGQASVKWIADTNMPVGDCQVDTGQWRLVASLDEQLARIEKRLSETLDHAQIERRGIDPVNSKLGRVPDRRGIA